MLAVKLAFRNLLGAGLRTWLNVAVLSFTFVVIVFYNGMLDGWNKQAMNDTREWEVGAGQLWHPTYDRYDPFSLSDAHGRISTALQQYISASQLTPILITQASLYPSGRMLNIQMKGIDPQQKLLKIPSAVLQATDDGIPAILGRRMAKMAKLRVGDRVMVQWRDKHGTFDAREIVVKEIFDANVPSIDQGQVWVALNDLQEMTGLTGEATLLVAAQGFLGKDVDGWKFRDKDFLLKDYAQIMESKRAGSKIIYGLLLAISLLAIFDTQVLAVFRRQKEIGTYIALGMTRWQVVRIFTIEGAAHSILALIAGALYGVPILLWLNQKGIPIPASTDDMGLSITDSIIPVYSAGMIISSVLLVVISAAIVSYFPASRIAKMKPTDALKGKIQ